MKARFLSYYLLLLVSASAVLLTGCEKTPDVQQVAAVEVTNITSNSAECIVTVSLNNSSKIIERGIMYDSREWTNQTVITDANAGEGTFTVKLENLLPGTIYGVRGYAKNSEGVVYSVVSSFKTPLKEGTMTDSEGNVYKTIIIGNQEWMAENMKSVKYNDGTAIPNVTVANTWRGDTKGAYCIYSNVAANKDIYGCLYNRYAVNKRGADNTSIFLPLGWRIPTLDEWQKLQNHLINHGYAYGGVIDDLIGKSMASQTLWSASEVAGAIGYEMDSNNQSLFNALPSGYRSDIGAYSNLSKATRFWTSTPSGTGFGYVTLSYDAVTLTSGVSPAAGGCAVRCIRDAQ